jgi:hypothetical protein
VNVGFQIRAPWYERERHGWSVNDPPALRPAIQKYDSSDFVKRLTTDPRDSLSFDDEDDRWGYPLPVVPSPTTTGRARFATHRMVRTDLRKLFQPSHDRFYAVVVEVFCDSPGLPRAGYHDDFEVGFYLRRYSTTYLGGKKATKALTHKILVAWTQEPALAGLTQDQGDWKDVWTADAARRSAFEQENADLIARVAAHTVNEAWLEDRAAGRRTWAPIPAEDDRAFPEKEHRMFRLPVGEDECPSAHRSSWFGVVPTFTADHGKDGAGHLVPMLDDRAIYYLQPYVKLKLKPGHEHCPSVRILGAPSAPFRLADPMDPDGTKNRIVTIKLPDLRRLGARAGQPFGPGGVRIVTPPGSHLGPVPFKDIPNGSSSPSGSGQICTFAIELFFIVAFFLFLMFLPIVVLIFQLWFLLALRFCIPPSLSFSALGQFFVGGGVTAGLDAALGAGATVKANAVLGFPDPTAAGEKDGIDLFSRSKANGGLGSTQELGQLYAAIDPLTAVQVPAPPDLEPVPDDPLC